MEYAFTSKIKQLLAEPETDINQGLPEEKKLPGDTPLYLAARMGDTGIVGTLLDAGAYVDMPSTWINSWQDKKIVRRRTPLVEAASNGDLDMVKLLLKHSANVNATLFSPDGPSVLYIAMKVSRQHRSRIVNLLLDAGVDLSYQDEKGRTPLSMAEKYLGKSSSIYRRIRKALE